MVSPSQQVYLQLTMDLLFNVMKSKSIYNDYRRRITFKNSKKLTDEEKTVKISKYLEKNTVTKCPTRWCIGSIINKLFW